LFAKAALRQGSRIGIHDNHIGANAGAIGQLQAADAALFDQHGSDFGVVVERHAPLHAKAGQCLRQLHHASCHRPYAAAFDVRYEHQRRRARIGRGSTVSRIAPEQLQQARIVEVFLQDTVQRFKWRDLPQLGHAPQSDRAHQLHGTRAAASHERLIEQFEYLLCALCKATVAICLALTGKSPDRSGALLSVTKKIELRAISPGMTCQTLERREGNALTKTGAGALENIVEHPGHGEHRRAAVKALSCDLELTELATGLALFLQQRDV
jgi:hypothetical protein